jgi:ATP-dependent Clp protease ATP-binding subunit ClpA
MHPTCSSRRLSAGAIRCIGSTTYKEYRQFFEKDRALVRRFQKIDVNEPTIPDAIEILKGLKPYFEDYHKVGYTDDAIKAAVELSARYINDRKLPDKAIDVIDETGARADAVAGKEPQEDLIDVEDREHHRHHGPDSAKTVSKDDEVLANLDKELRSVVSARTRHRRR